jgi:hypothetical protein
MTDAEIREVLRVLREMGFAARLVSTSPLQILLTLPGETDE